MFHALSIQVQKLTTHALEAVQAKDFSLVHVRFGFDRTRMQRMHAALLSALECTEFKMLPPDPPSTSKPAKVPPWAEWISQLADLI